MATLHFELVAPERVLYSGEVEAVMLPGTEGDMTVLPGHAPVMTSLKTGFVVVTDRQNHGTRVLVRGGFAGDLERRDAARHQPRRRLSGRRQRHHRAASGGPRGAPLLSGGFLSITMRFD